MWPTLDLPNQHNYFLKHYSTSSSYFYLYIFFYEVNIFADWSDKKPVLNGKISFPFEFFPAFAST